MTDTRTVALDEDLPLPQERVRLIVEPSRRPFAERTVTLWP